MSDQPAAEKSMKVPPEHIERLISGEITLAQFAGLSQSALYRIASIAYQLLEAGKAEKALPLYKGLVAASPLDSVFHCHLGATYYALKELDKAFEHYSSALRFNKANVDALAGRGELYLHRRQLLEAAADFRAAIEADPKARSRSTQRAREALALLLRAAEKAEATKRGEP